jgi:hypothetical protein
MKVSTYIITSITLRPIRLTVILVIMSVSTFNTAVVLYVTSHGVSFESLYVIKAEIHVHFLYVLKLIKYRRLTKLSDF